MVLKIIKMIKKNKILFVLSLGLSFNLSVNFNCDLNLEVNFTTLVFVLIGYHAFKQITKVIATKLHNN